MKRYAEPNRVNRKRRKREFERCFHSKARVEFTQRSPCIVPSCPQGPCHNAHIQNGGMSRKADYPFIVPACPQHHHVLDAELGRKKFEELYQVDLAAEAIDHELKWQQHLAAEEDAPHAF